jgi:hypothetical protein
MGISRGNCNGYSLIKLQNEDGAFVDYWLAMMLTTISEN